MCCRVYGCHIITKILEMLTENQQFAVAGHSTKTKHGIRFKLIKAIANILHPHVIRDAIGVVTHTLNFYHENIHKLSGIWSHHFSFKLAF